jgi:polyhydroxyalkanoate synthase
MDPRNKRLDEFYRVPTSDGWKIALWRHKPDELDKKIPPVILCHGMLSNRFDLDFNEKHGDKYSLARYLANGEDDEKVKFDVWVLELRGRGRGYERSYSPLTQPLKYDWDFDTYVEHDVPDAIRFVKRKRDSESVLWIGHSMGGMLAYAYGETEEGKQSLQGAITIGSPAKFDGAMANLIKAEFILFLFKAWCNTPRQGRPFLLPWMAGSLIDYIPQKIIDEVAKIIANVENVDMEVLNEFLEKGGDVSSTKLVYHLLFCAETNNFCKFPRWPRLCKKFRDYPILSKIFCPDSYGDNLKNFVSPILLIAGGGDQLGTPDAVFYAYDKIGSKDKEYREFSIDRGYSADYGHIDLVIGRNSKKEVFKEIYDWLKKHM